MNMFDPATAAKKKALTGAKKTAQTVSAVTSSPTAATTTAAAAAAAVAAAAAAANTIAMTPMLAPVPNRDPPSQNIKAWVMEFLPEPIRPEIQSISIAEFQCGEYSMNFARSPWANVNCGAKATTGLARRRRPRRDRPRRRRWGRRRGEPRVVRQARWSTGEAEGTSYAVGLAAGASPQRPWVGSADPTRGSVGRAAAEGCEGERVRRLRCRS